MKDELKKSISDICADYGNDAARMMDIIKAVHAKHGHVPSAAMDLIAAGVSSHRVEVESHVSFYSFLADKPKGEITVRLCNDIVDKLHGVDQIAKALSLSLGIAFGETTSDGRFTLEYTPCIGMCDQAPAVLINDVVVTRLCKSSAVEIINDLKKHGDPSKLVKKFGDGNNSNELIKAMVDNNIREEGPVILSPRERGLAIRHALAMTPAEVIRAIKTARLRGRGGAGFPTGMKWEFTRAAEGKKKVIICNADEGEPGTFKDRVILTERPALMFEGMAVGAYAIGADTGIVYLRAEYAYLKAWLESILQELREQNLLGKSILGKEGFDFDIRIQMGAGAYICGEETALISSCEGLRGDPKNRPPFPAQKGYLGYPTAVNNVETLCCVARILDKGAGWFSKLGNQASSGTKLLSVSGDCTKPGVYELPFGISIKELLAKVGADNTLAVQVGGPSGQMIGVDEFDRVICFEDLATGGSIIVFSADRNPLRIASAFMEFFVEESCGYCTPCRVGNLLIKQRLDQVLDGKGEASDLEYLEDLCNSVKTTSRCGLGQTSPNPVQSTLKNFRSFYEELLIKESSGLQPSFDLQEALVESEELVKRRSVHL